MIMTIFLIAFTFLFSVSMSCFPKQDEGGYGEGKDDENGDGYGNGDKLFGYSDHGYVDEGFGHTRFACFVCH